jgi:hypothetical protein
MKFSATLFCFFLISAFTVENGHAQNYIGMNKEQIIEVMSETHKNFKRNTSVVNPYYKYLKYENKISEITILFFLSDDNMCTMVRQMCDYSNINDVLSELNQKYTSTAKNIWSYKDGGKTYEVNLVEEEWYFTITTKLKD